MQEFIALSITITHLLIVLSRRGVLSVKVDTVTMLHSFIGLLQIVLLHGHCTCILVSQS